MHKGLLGHNAGVVDEKLRGKVIYAVDHKVVVGDQVGDVGGVDKLLVGIDRDVGVDVLHRLLGAFHLRLADVGRGMDHLTLQVGKIDLVGIDNADGAHTGSGQIQGRRCTQAAGANDKDAGIQELLLPLDANLLQDDVARIALKLFIRKSHAIAPLKLKRNGDRLKMFQVPQVAAKEERRVLKYASDGLSGKMRCLGHF